MLALWLPFSYHSSHPGIIIFALAYGFTSDAFVSLLMPCVAKSGSIETLGRRFRTFQVIMSVAYVYYDENYGILATNVAQQPYRTSYHGRNTGATGQHGVLGSNTFRWSGLDCGGCTPRRGNISFGQEARYVEGLA
jgi:hypothetical protein